jgi:ribosomal protein L29
MAKEKIKKFEAMKIEELKKELSTLRANILTMRIDIANRKTKGIHKISQTKKDIARIKTIISAKERENNE